MPSTASFRPSRATLWCAPAADAAATGYRRSTGRGAGGRGRGPIGAPQVCLLVVNGAFSFAALNSIASAFSVNSLFSLFSANSAFAIGCASGFFEICIEGGEYVALALGLAFVLVAAAVLTSVARRMARQAADCERGALVNAETAPPSYVGVDKKPVDW